MAVISQYIDYKTTLGFVWILSNGTIYSRIGNAVNDVTYTSVYDIDVARPGDQYGCYVYIEPFDYLSPAVFYNLTGERQTESTSTCIIGRVNNIFYCPVCRRLVNDGENDRGEGRR